MAREEMKMKNLPFLKPIALFLAFNMAFLNIVWALDIRQKQVADYNDNNADNFSTK